jgi:hypothetical protein
VRVLKINNFETYDWLLNKHYAKRIPSISYSFGLYIDNVLEGVCTFGMPPSSTLAESICGFDYKKNVLELNRLVANDNLPKNSLSFFVSNSINKLLGNKIIVSFSDLNMQHYGYIYQATNFIYTGLTSNTTTLIDKDGLEFHFRNIGHYQKNNKLNAKLVKRRINEDKIDKKKIAYFLRQYKKDFTAKKLDLHFGYKDTCAHWFRKDSGFSFPNIDDWKKLKKLLKFNDTYDDIMLNFELVPCSKDIIKKLKLKKINILPKHRYIYFKGSKTFKQKCKQNLKLNILNYPKGQNKNYDASYKPQTQIKLEL